MSTKTRGNLNFCPMSVQRRAGSCDVGQIWQRKHLLRCRRLAEFCPCSLHFTHVHLQRFEWDSTTFRSELRPQTSKRVQVQLCTSSPHFHPYSLAKTRVGLDLNRIRIRFASKDVQGSSVLHFFSSFQPCSLTKTRVGLDLNRIRIRFASKGVKFTIRFRIHLFGDATQHSSPCVITLQCFCFSPGPTSL